MPSAPERLRRVRELFDAVMDRPPGERTAFLASATAWDVPTREEVQGLVAAAEEPGNTFGSAFVAESGTANPRPMVWSANVSVHTRSCA